MTREDEDVSEAIKDIMLNEGINIEFEETIQEVKDVDDGLEITLKNKTIKGSHILVALVGPSCL